MPLLARLLVRKGNGDDDKGTGDFGDAADFVGDTLAGEVDVSMGGGLGDSFCLI